MLRALRLLTLHLHVDGKLVQVPLAGLLVLQPHDPRAPSVETGAFEVNLGSPLGSWAWGKKDDRTTVNGPRLGGSRVGSGFLTTLAWLTG